jgi:hypothetical protein
VSSPLCKNAGSKTGREYSFLKNNCVIRAKKTQSNDKSIMMLADAVLTVVNHNCVGQLDVDVF